MDKKELVEGYEQDKEYETFPVRILAIFFAEFHPIQGPQIVHQVPPNAVTLEEGEANKRPLFEFEPISEYIIPKRKLCDRVVAICTNGYRILGHPVCIVDGTYERNALIFNCALVFREEDDSSCYIPVVRRLAKVFRSLEEQGNFISKDKTKMIIYNIIEQIMEDLNNYCECMISIDESNTINIKLFPTFSNPPKVLPHQVPILTVQLDLLMNVNWDLTVRKVVPFIDGINSVKRITELANVDYTFICRCMEHLLYYGCLIIVDIFQFSNMYAPTPDINMLVEDLALREECLAYISTRHDVPLSFAFIFHLYCSLRQRITLKNWIIENRLSLRGIDIRRFISFGIIKGFLYRIHRYPFLTENNSSDNTNESLLKYLDGTHNMDEICTETKKSIKEVETELKSFGKIDYIHR
ncbi:nitrogen permease regulating protein NPR2 [Pneumocystis jirovecii RU7]|uniref:Nitrogen permease regulator 2 n=1 Tax=Pneumocystis jirovecii (strain RU7) TaxID=1408657 RepID=A0A0W4ZSG6_PNEJ7|nr:nitrogen permease regulating protein NPR2 [Pneumocystis jirovecii RU7]KTW31318.1 hypothetical protein T551_01390 [Pneumocystis jirovecii RU7]